MTDQPKTRHRVLAMLSLILAGEAVYIPPFHLNRYFKSTMLEAWGIDESQLGNLFAVYGIVAMVCYFLGGPVADRFSPSKLLSVSLIATAAGAVYMGTFPSFAGLYWLYAFWGASTVLLFWSPLIRATREWGGTTTQGRAFGLLDAGRGLAAALVARIATEIFEYCTCETVRDAQLTLRYLLWFYAAVAVLAAACVLLFIRQLMSEEIAVNEDVIQESPAKQSLLSRVRAVLSRPTTWLQAIVIFAAYSVFRGFDYYGLYLEHAYGFTKTESAITTTALSFIRFGAALLAGWVADKFFGVGRTLAICFALLLTVYAEFLAVPYGAPIWLIATLALSCLAMYGLRGIYFAPLESTGMPRELTGTAVGVICFVGFLPEIFMPKLCGHLVTSAREAGNVIVGYEQIFWFLGGLSLLGALAALMLGRVER